MAQFDVLLNVDRRSRERVPYLLDVQSDLLDLLSTRVVVPLCNPDLVKGLGAQRLNPAFEIEGRTLLMLTQELAAVHRNVLGDRVANLAGQRNAIISALDLLITGS
jgi:toxin CcdB